MTYLVIAGICLFLGFVFGVIWATQEVEKMHKENARLRAERNRYREAQDVWKTPQKMYRGA